MDTTVPRRVSGTPFPAGLIPSAPAPPEYRGPQPRPGCKPRPP